MTADRRADHPASLPLAGVRVVEFATVMAGPVCGLLLADLGADVIKVEKPSGDDTRRFHPPDVRGVAAAFLMVNRGKRGIAIDLKHQDARAVALRLIAGADILVENFRKGTMEQFGLGYATLRQSYPRLIYCAVSGYGRTGPYADEGGFDLVAQGMSGLMSITGEGPSRPPVKVGAPVTDITAGLLAAVGILAAIVRRQRTGEGAFVDTSLFEAGIMQTYWQSAMALATGMAPGPLGSAHPLSAPYQAFETASGWITVGAASETTWRRLLGVLDAPRLAQDPCFRTSGDRVRNMDALAETLAPLFRARPSEAWLDALKASGVPSGPVLDIPGMLAHPQTIARDMVIEAEHPDGGSTRALGMAVKISGAATSSRAKGAPALAADAWAILREVGYGDDEIAGLIASGAVLAPPSAVEARRTVGTADEG